MTARRIFWSADQRTLLADIMSGLFPQQPKTKAEVKKWLFENQEKHLGVNYVRPGFGDPELVDFLKYLQDDAAEKMAKAYQRVAPARSEPVAKPAPEVKPTARQAAEAAFAAPAPKKRSEVFKEMVQDALAEARVMNAALGDLLKPMVKRVIESQFELIDSQRLSQKMIAELQGKIEDLQLEIMVLKDERPTQPVVEEDEPTKERAKKQRVIIVGVHEAMQSTIEKDVGSQYRLIWIRHHTTAAEMRQRGIDEHHTILCRQGVNSAMISELRKFSGPGLLHECSTPNMVIETIKHIQFEN